MTPGQPIQAQQAKFYVPTWTFVIVVTKQSIYWENFDVL